MEKLGCVFLMIAVFSSGCNYIPTNENKAKSAVALSLIDSESARFESIAKGKLEGDYCGMVNGKNRMGGYAGAAYFTYEAKYNKVTMLNSMTTDRDFELLYKSRDSERIGDITDGCIFPAHYLDICGVKIMEDKSKFCNFFKSNGSADISELYKQMRKEFN